MSKVLLIGDIVVDVTLKSQHQDLKLRMGGIVHAARGLWALNIPYTVGYFSPSYLDDQIQAYLKDHGCEEVIKLGNVVGAPYVFLVQDAKEVGNQGYEFLLRDEIKIDFIQEGIEQISKSKFDDTILISGNYDQAEIIKRLSGNIHIDVANNVTDFNFFKPFGKKVDTLFVSTSSTIFQNFFKNDFKDFVSLFKPYAEKLILKENRGGSRGFVFKSNELFSASSQTAPIQHSIGVGDVFDSCFISKCNIMSNEEALVLSSWVAYEYASTTYPDDFKKGVERILKPTISTLINILGVSLPWEERSSISIYIAAPDFEHVDTTTIDLLESSLSYHNFRPRRPIKENGLMEVNASKARKQTLFNKDIVLLEECSILIAVLIFNDPGTLIEIGLASAKGIPTIVYDPFNQAENCMLTELPNLVSNDLDKIISEVFIESAKIKNNEK